MSVPAGEATVPAAAAQAEPPRLWLVIGDKLGDNAQIEIIAEALGWPAERKELRFKPQYVTGKPRFSPSLYHLDLNASAPLQPPWPDVVLTIGRRPSMAALWIKEQSGGRTKVVVVGRPRKQLESFDLIVATSQYRVPARANVLKLQLPLMRGRQEAIAAAAERWRERFAALPKPITALLVGGPTQPFVFDRAVAGELMARVRAEIERSGGTLYVTTSRRTPPAVMEAIAEALPPNAHLHRWSPDGAENPYQALLALADRFVVTGDSISMMVEVARLGRPLGIFALPERLSLAARLRRKTIDWVTPDDTAVPGGLSALLYRLGLVAYARDLGALHRRLYALGVAAPLGERALATTKPLADETPEVTEKIRSLFANI